MTTDRGSSGAIADPDAALIAACRRELPYNTVAFERLVERHEHAVFGLCRRYLEDDGEAEEATQDTFMKVFRHLTGFRAQSTFRTWLLRIATNECASRYRRRARLREQEAGYRLASTAEHPTAPAEPLDDGLVGPVGAALAGLGATDREILVLRHLGDLAIKEVAAALELGLSATKMRLYRAEERFRTAYLVRRSDV